MRDGHAPLTVEERMKAMAESGPAAVVTDCKSLYDSVNGSESSCVGLSDKRAAIEVLAAKQALATNGIGVRWVHSHAQ
eukprot:21415-Alexandrium_andersonii.AAC.1